MSGSTSRAEAALAAGALTGLIAWAARHRRSASWESTLQRVSHGVVVVRVSSVMAFDMTEVCARHL